MLLANPQMEPRTELATIIRKARTESGLKQEIFAREVGVVAAHLSRLEHGQGLPSITLIQKIADRFGADRNKMMRLLRNIKGFEDEPAKASRRPSLRGIPAPVVPAPMCLEWIETIEEGGVPGGEDGVEPITRAMTRDKRAFWVTAEGPGMCGGQINEWDLLLVEPSSEPIDGKPALVFLERKIMVRKFRDVGEKVFLEPACSEQDPMPTLAREEFEEKGGRAFRIAGVRPMFRPFYGPGAKKR